MADTQVALVTSHPEVAALAAAEVSEVSEVEEAAPLEAEVPVEAGKIHCKASRRSFVIRSS